MPVTAGLIVGGVTAVTSGIKAYRAHKQLKELQKQAMPNYSVTPEMQNAFQRAEGMTGRGFTGAEEAAFKSNLGQSSNTSYRQAMDQSGGGMSQAILGGINSRNVGAINQFAGQDAALRRQNIQYADSLAGQIQGQENLASGQEIANRLEMERGYGQAVSQNLNNAQSAINYGLTAGLPGLINKKEPSQTPASSAWQAPYVPTTIMQGGIYGQQQAPIATPISSSVFGQGQELVGINYQNPFR